MSVRIINGDMLEVLPTLEAGSFHSCVTDPPYHLTSIVNRFGADNAAPAKAGATGVYARSSAGFMGAKWDGGRVAFESDTWAQVYRVLKPGAHLVAFGGTRTWHRMAVAIEDAGFEIRDTCCWLYGSGFPKSHDVSKGIDKAAYSAPLFSTIRAHIRQWRDKREMSNHALNSAVGSGNNGCGMARHWTSEAGGQHAIPSKEQWVRLKEVLSWPDCELDEIYGHVKEGAERPVVGKYDGDMGGLGGGRLGAFAGDITAPATPEAAAWSGWGTALKPAFEPIILARKPLSGTVAANTLKHGCGGLNIDACRVPGTPEATRFDPARHSHEGYRMTATGADCAERASPLGRWPANVLHDGSPEVEEAFARFETSQTGARSDRSKAAEVSGTNWLMNNHQSQEYTDTGSASRFFKSCPYEEHEWNAHASGAEGSQGSKELGDTASLSGTRFHFCGKADATDRAGSSHPTVKPQSLMSWLVKLVTPPNGTVLDPFAGTGSTGLAADRLGMNAVLIERDAQYAADARRKIESDAPLFTEVA